MAKKTKSKPQLSSWAAPNKSNMRSNPSVVSTAKNSVVEQLRRVEQKRFKVLSELESDPFLGYKDLDEAYSDYKVTSNVETLSRMLNHENLFISGPAGSGKTTLLKKFIEIVDADSDGKVNVALTASTGIAAQLIGGRTVHSWSGLGIMSEEFTAKNIPKFVFSRLKDIQTVDILIIDEISMLPAYFFTNLDKLLKWAKRNTKPFGGVQMIVTGDFQQLAPVNNNKDVDGGFAITTKEWEEADFKYCYLDKLHRATDKKLKYVLESISRGEVDYKTRALINSRMASNVEKTPGKVYTTLYTTNKNVDLFNEEELAKNPNPVRLISSTSIGKDKKKIATLYKQNNIPEVLKLKIGATVMLTSNLAHNLPNGSIGKVVHFGSDGLPKVAFNNGQTAYIGRIDYKLEESVTVTDPKDKTKEIRFNETIATVSQVPLKLAYAISVHKSQGQTFDGVVANLKQCFAPSLGYIALSRVKSLDDLIIEDFSERAYMIDDQAKDISNFVKRSAVKDRKVFQADEEHYASILQHQMYRLL